MQKVSIEKGDVRAMFPEQNNMTDQVGILMALGMPLAGGAGGVMGVAVGAIVGAATDNIGLWMTTGAAIGGVIGLLIGAALSAQGTVK